MKKNTFNKEKILRISKKILFSLVFVLILAFCLPFMIPSRIQIDSAEIEQVLVDVGYDSRKSVDGTMLKEDAEKITHLTLSNLWIKDAIDLKKFINLESLTITANDIVELDLRGLSKLRYVNASKNKIKNILLDPEVSISYLDLTYNELDSLQISKAPFLHELIVSHNPLSFVCLEDNSNLKSISLDYSFSENNNNQLQIRRCPELQSIQAQYSHFTEAYLDELPRLYNANFFANQIQVFSAENIYSLQIVNLHQNKDLHCIQLGDIEGIQSFIDSHQYLSLDCSIAPEDKKSQELVFSRKMQSINRGLEQVLFQNGIDTDIDGLIPVSVASLIKELSLSHRSLRKIPDLSILTNLVSLDVSYNDLSEINLRQYPALRYVQASNNKISTLAYHPGLEYLDLSSNDLTAFSGQEGLRELNLSFNKIADVDLNKSPSLRRVNLSYNKMVLPETSLPVDIENISHELTETLGLAEGVELLDINVLGNLKKNVILPAITVDSIHIPDLGFRAGLRSLGIDFRGEYCAQPDISSIKILPLHYQKIEDLSGIEFFTHLEILHLEHNLLSEIDLSKNTSLREVYADNNLLEKIIFPDGHLLHKISLKNNLFSELEFPDTSALVSVDVSFNKIKNLRVPHSSRLRSLVAHNNQMNDLPFLGDTPYLRELNLSHNMLSKKIDIKHSQLELLDLSFNQLRGVNITNIGNLKKISVIGNPYSFVLLCTYNQKKYFSEFGFLEKESYHRIKTK